MLHWQSDPVRQILAWAIHENFEWVVFRLIRTVAIRLFRPTRPERDWRKGTWSIEIECKIAIRYCNRERICACNAYQAVFATGRASPPGYGRAMGWAWAGRKILEINGLWAGPGWKIWKTVFLSHMSFIVENYQLFSAHQHHCQENINKHIKVNCFCCLFKLVLGNSVKSGTFYM